MSVTLTEFANICNDRLDEQPFATMNRRQDSTICMRIRTHVHVTQQLRNMSVSHKHRVYCKWSCVAHTQTHAYILPYICMYKHMQPTLHASENPNLFFHTDVGIDLAFNYYIGPWVSPDPNIIPIHSNKQERRLHKSNGFAHSQISQIHELAGSI